MSTNINNTSGNVWGNVGGDFNNYVSIGNSEVSYQQMTPSQVEEKLNDSKGVRNVARRTRFTYSIGLIVAALIFAVVLAYVVARGQYESVLDFLD